MIGGSYYCDDLGGFEVFDSVTKKFTSIKSVPKWVGYLDPNKLVCVGYNIYVFLGEENNEVKVHNYDIKKNIISIKTSIHLRNTKSFSCTKVSMY